MHDPVLSQHFSLSEPTMKIRSACHLQPILFCQLYGPLDFLHVILRMIRLDPQKACLNERRYEIILDACMGAYRSNIILARVPTIA